MIMVIFGHKTPFVCRTNFIKIFKISVELQRVEFTAVFPWLAYERHISTIYEGKRLVG